MAYVAIFFEIQPSDFYTSNSVYRFNVLVFPVLKGPEKNNIKKEERREAIKFNPCVSGQCTDQGTHCQGCGRSHEKIAETQKMVQALVAFAQAQDYENYEDFAQFVAKSVVKKLQNPT